MAEGAGRDRIGRAKNLGAGWHGWGRWRRWRLRRVALVGVVDREAPFQARGILRLRPRVGRRLPVKIAASRERAQAAGRGKRIRNTEAIFRIRIFRVLRVGPQSV